MQAPSADLLQNIIEAELLVFRLGHTQPSRQLNLQLAGFCLQVPDEQPNFHALLDLLQNDPRLNRAQVTAALDADAPDGRYLLLSA